MQKKKKLRQKKEEKSEIFTSLQQMCKSVKIQE